MFAEVAINHKYAFIQERLTYALPEGMKVHVGMLVQVPFRKIWTNGIVVNITDQKPGYAMKEIAEILFPEPLLYEWQLKLAIWMQKEYDTPLHKILALFLPEKIWDGSFGPEDKPRTQKKIMPMTLDHAPGKNLSDEQQNAVNVILQNDQKTTLLYGVHGSGKTEVYCQAAQKIIAAGKQVCLIVPDRSAIPQVYSYVKALFGEHVALWTAQQSKTEQAAAWWKIQTGKAHIAIGTRGVLFAPFQKLGLMILDEEHEWSYRSEQSPRYHPQEIITHIQKEHPETPRAVYGSATPNVTTWYYAHHTKKYDFAAVKDRITSFAATSKSLPLHGASEKPTVTVVDLRDELKKGNHSPLSDDLIEAVSATLQRKEQSVLIVNRRGFASAVLCRTCGYTERCAQCKRPLTYHVAFGKDNQTTTLLCHHCSIRAPFRLTCPQCNNTTLKFIGSGTQQVEAELKKRFPLARIIRADQDTLSMKDAHSMLFEKVLEGTVDIVIGTSAISKNLDCPKVTCAAILLADQPLYSPDFRSNEQAFQLISAVCGRAGRRDIRGHVIIQTYNPDHPTIRAAINNDYESFAEEELNVRKLLEFPPYTEMIVCTYQSPEQRDAEQEATMMATMFKNRGATVVVAPNSVPKKGLLYQMDVIVRSTRMNDILANISLKRGWRKTRVS